MAAVNAADAWQQSRVRGERPPAAPRSERASYRERAAHDEHAPYGDAPRYTRPPVPRRDGQPGRPVSRPAARDYPAPRRPAPQVDPRGDRSPNGRRPPVAEQPAGSRVRGILAVLAVFLLTLAGAGIDSFIGMGLGTITLVTLVATTAIATLLVQRRDIVSVLVAPPLVFVAVAAIDIALAPSAHFNLATIATLLIRGFPTMAVATGAALVLALVRLAVRR